MWVSYFLIHFPSERSLITQQVPDQPHMPHSQAHSVSVYKNVPSWVTALVNKATTKQAMT